MQGKCPKCDAEPHIIVEAIRARDEASKKTIPVLQFLCDQCRTILGVSLAPTSQEQIVAELRTVGEDSQSNQ
jgi:hypothetical protein